jgi:bifunctional DNA-binding transcriptional regulator/antitoxin component of YhaV-PrlF toxin-antitoxin module
MTVVGMSKITSKGQVTLPLYVRRLLKLDRGQSIAFCLDKSGILISRCKVSVEEAGFSKAQWQKIERLAGTKGKAFSSPDEAKRYVKTL